MTRRLQIRPLEPISSSVILFRLFAVLIALSLMFGPLAMDGAMAAGPVASHAQMSDDGHCPPADEGTAGALSKPCCAAMCAPAALLTQARSDDTQFSRQLAVPAAVSFLRGVLSEISTPPPRAA